jgi:hypothetical protein
MDEIDAIQAQIRAMLRARTYLLELVPTDMVAATDVTERIIDLNHRQAAITSDPLTLTAPAQDELIAAIRDLDAAIVQSAAVDQILAGVAKVVSSG